MSCTVLRKPIEFSKVWRLPAFVWNSGGFLSNYTEKHRKICVGTTSLEADQKQGNSRSEKGIPEFSSSHLRFYKDGAISAPSGGLLTFVLTLTFNLLMLKKLCLGFYCKLIFSYLVKIELGDGAWFAELWWSYIGPDLQILQSLLCASLAEPSLQSNQNFASKNILYHNQLKK